MLTAHLPSGYVLAWLWPAAPKGLMPAALAGAVFPDLDMIWFHLVDDRAFQHHLYWVHIPLFWLCVAALVLPVLALWGRDWLGAGAVFLAAIGVHLLLDTIGGGVMWGAPWSRDLVTLVTVPARHGHWVVNFLLHWTFWAEIAIWLWAGVLLWRARRRGQGPLRAAKPGR